MAWLALSLLILIVISEGISYFMYSRKSFRPLKGFYDSISRKKAPIDDVRTFNLRYAEHPFLAITSNPEFKNSFGEKMHNKYGFRHKDDFSDIDEKKDLVVYCTGGSSTYCNFIERTENTWPSILESKLSENIREKTVRVINGSCSGWTSYQSLIRFCAWVDILKPKLVIIYHGKNDFAPFVNSKLSIREIHPDYGNVMHSLRFDSIATRLPFFAKHSYTGKVLYGSYVNYKYSNILWHIYDQSKPATPEERLEGLKRIGAIEWEFIISRYRSFISLCKDRNISLLFVTQKIVSDTYGPYIDELNRRIKLLESQSDNCFVYDFASDIKDATDILYDGVHFTENGARICAEHIRNYIVKNVPLFSNTNRERNLIKDRNIL